MTRNEANVFLAVILETVAAAGAAGAPSGPMYAAMMGRMDLGDYQTLVGIATDCGLVTQASNVVHITLKGRDTVAKIDASRASKAAS